jgi:hypothetical protein
MSEMKTAWEKAMEKVEKLGKPSDEELKQLEHVPTGNKLAARYLGEDDYDLDAELTKYKGTGIRKHVVHGAEEIFLRNITLPHNEQTKQTIRRAMAGIKLLKENKNQLEAIFDRINNLLTYYEQARQQSFTQFKQSFEAKLQEASQALQQQLGTGASIQAELQQQFQEEWRRMSSQLDAQYEKALEEHRQEILKIA